MADYSPYLLPKTYLKYLGIKIPEGTRPNDTRHNDYGSNTIPLYDLRSFSPLQTVSNKTKSRYLEYVIHLSLNSNIYWKEGKPQFSVNTDTLGESNTDRLLTSMNINTVTLTYEAIYNYIHSFRR